MNSKSVQYAEVLLRASILWLREFLRGKRTETVKVRTEDLKVLENNLSFCADVLGVDVNDECGSSDEQQEQQNVQMDPSVAAEFLAQYLEKMREYDQRLEQMRQEHMRKIKALERLEEEMINEIFQQRLRSKEPESTGLETGSEKVGNEDDAASLERGGSEHEESPSTGSETENA